MPRKLTNDEARKCVTNQQDWIKERLEEFVEKINKLKPEKDKTMDFIEILDNITKEETEIIRKWGEHIDKMVKDFPSIVKITEKAIEKHFEVGKEYCNRLVKEYGDVYVYTIFLNFENIIVKDRIKRGADPIFKKVPQEIAEIIRKNNEINISKILSGSKTLRSYDPYPDVADVYRIFATTKKGFPIHMRFASIYGSWGDPDFFSFNIFFAVNGENGATMKDMEPVADDLIDIVMQHFKTTNREIGYFRTGKEKINVLKEKIDIENKSTWQESANAAYNYEN